MRAAHSKFDFRRTVLCLLQIPALNEFQQESCEMARLDEKQILNYFKQTARLCERIVRDRDEAEEIAGELVLKCVELNRANYFDSDDHLRRFMLNTHNKVRQGFYRSHVKEISFTIIENTLRRSTGDGYGKHADGEGVLRWRAGVTPARQENIVYANEILVALSTLPQMYTRILKKRIDGASPVEICRELDLTPRSLMAAYSEIPELVSIACIKTRQKLVED